MAAAQGMKFLEQEQARAVASAASQAARKQSDLEEAARLAQIEEERRQKTERNLKAFEERTVATAMGGMLSMLHPLFSSRVCTFPSSHLPLSTSPLLSSPGSPIKTEGRCSRLTVGLG